MRVCVCACVHACMCVYCTCGKPDPHVILSRSARILQPSIPVTWGMVCSINYSSNMSLILKYLLLYVVCCHHIVCTLYWHRKKNLWMSYTCVCLCVCVCGVCVRMCVCACVRECVAWCIYYLHWPEIKYGRLHVWEVRPMFLRLLLQLPTRLIRKVKLGSYSKIEQYLCSIGELPVATMTTLILISFV